MDENGVCILEQHPTLQEASTTNPDERTKLNIQDSDGTLILVPCLPLPEKIKDGTILTIEYAKERNKPHLIISVADKADVIDMIRQWLDENNIRVLNIAGPRESSSPGIYDGACAVFQELFTAVSFRPQF